MSLSSGIRLAWSEPPVACCPDPPTPDAVERISREISRQIARIDRAISETLDVILHHPRLQELEATWRGLQYLVDSVPPGAGVRVQVLNVSWKTLSRDFERSAEFDSSHLFRLVYNESFGTAGGQPFGLLIGAYRIQPRPNASHPISDLPVLTAISQVAAAAFSPFVAAAHPSLLGLESWSELERPVDLQRTFEQLEFVRWQQIREAEDMSFIGLALPGMLLRLPRDRPGDCPGLSYQERAGSDGTERLLWGNAAFAFAAVVVRSFAETSWLAAIRGTSIRANDEDMPEGVAETGGLVTGLPIRFFESDPHRVQPLPPVEVSISEGTERDLSEHGFIALTAVRHTSYCAFYSNRSVRRLVKMTDAIAEENSRVASQLQYVLCVSRFAHFLKIIARDMVGSYADAESLEGFLNGWIRQYVTQDPNASPETRATYPLREAVVQVREVPGKPGAYMSIVHLWPHSELDELQGAMSFSSELSSGRSR